ncbi:putative AP2/ERF domain-containing protein [Vibrio phage 15E36.1]|uniref:AP2/ERF domain-containing protein n=1 Tax=Vibrio phage 15E36.1 TaxID=2859290 RepID=A0AAE7XUP8_9CAUD|nr:putative AP2/ERF domain-containing protein [Vibrio phage 15E36.1]
MDKYYKRCIELFEHNDGALIYKSKPSNSKIEIGDVAGTVNKQGYLVVRVSVSGSSKLLKVHRVLFYLYHGYLPKVIDHLDGNRLNNKEDNIVESTPRSNASNMKCHRDGKLLGTTELTNGTWQSQIWWDERNVFLGAFETEEEAHTTYLTALENIELRGNPWAE